MLPLPFTLVGIGLLSMAEMFVFDRSAGRLRVSNWWKYRTWPLEKVKGLQLIGGHTVCPSSRCDGTTSGGYSTEQFNIVMNNSVVRGFQFLPSVLSTPLATARQERSVDHDRVPSPAACPCRSLTKFSNLSPEQFCRMDTYTRSNVESTL